MLLLRPLAQEKRAREESLRPRRRLAEGRAPREACGSGRIGELASSPSRKRVVGGALLEGAASQRVAGSPQGERMPVGEVAPPAQGGPRGGTLLRGEGEHKLHGPRMLAAHHQGVGEAAGQSVAALEGRRLRKQVEERSHGLGEAAHAHPRRGKRAVATLDAQKRITAGKQLDHLFRPLPSRREKHAQIVQLAFPKGEKREHGQQQIGGKLLAAQPRKKIGLARVFPAQTGHALGSRRNGTVRVGILPAQGNAPFRGGEEQIGPREDEAALLQPSVDVAGRSAAHDHLDAATEKSVEQAGKRSRPLGIEARQVLEHDQTRRFVETKHVGADATRIEVSQEAGRPAAQPENVREGKDDVGVGVGERGFPEAVRRDEETRDAALLQKARHKFRTRVVNASYKPLGPPAAAGGQLDERGHGEVSPLRRERPACSGEMVGSSLPAGNPQESGMRCRKASSPRGLSRSWRKIFACAEHEAQAFPLKQSRPRKKRLNDSRKTDALKHRQADPWAARPGTPTDPRGNEDLQ